MKKTNEYLISVELSSAIATANTPQKLTFKARSHDDVFAIVDKAKIRTGLNDDDAAALAIGLKLFGTIVLENRQNPLFSEIGLALHAFINKLKRG